MLESNVLTVTGMKCGGCETNIKEKLQAVEGVSSVTPSFKEKIPNPSIALLACCKVSP